MHQCSSLYVKLSVVNNVAINLESYGFLMQWTDFGPSLRDLRIWVALFIFSRVLFRLCVCLAAVKLTSQNCMTVPCEGGKSSLLLRCWYCQKIILMLVHSFPVTCNNSLKPLYIYIYIYAVQCAIFSIWNKVLCAGNSNSSQTVPVFKAG